MYKHQNVKKEIITNLYPNNKAVLIGNMVGLTLPSNKSYTIILDYLHITLAELVEA